MARLASDTRPRMRQRPAAQVFREEIDKAVAEGAALGDMTLQLTLHDSADLKRDRSLALSDISFSDGVMSFLGVKVASGGVVTSQLVRGDDVAG